MRILIENGDVFDGNWEMLDDCFGLMDEDDLIGFCDNMGFDYKILEPDVKVIH